MTVTISLRFTTGRYCATPWDVAVNNGNTEWPPSPWRVTRALLAVWHNRFGGPEGPLDQALMEGILNALSSERPWYRLSETRAGHTRHYMPKSDHKSHVTGATMKVLAPYLSIDAKTPVHITWPSVDLTTEQLTAVAQLTAGLSYFGRADSLCAAETAGSWPDGMSPEDEKWSKPVAVASPNRDDDRALVLCPLPAVTRPQLEVTTATLRKSRFLTPPGSEWVPYTLVLPAPSPPEGRHPKVHAIRWRLITKTPFFAKNAVLATDELRGTRVDRTTDSYLLTGHRGEKVVTRNEHVHWLWVEAQAAPGSGHSPVVRELVAYVPEGVEGQDFKQLLLGRRSEDPESRNPYPWRQRLRRKEHAGSRYVPGSLHLVDSGDAATVLPDGWTADSDGATVWQSATPFLSSVHTKPKGRRSPDVAVEKDVRREWEHRRPAGCSAEIAAVVLLEPQPGDSTYLRWRPNETDRRRRGGSKDREPRRLRITFTEPVMGPVILGALAHFGFGVFEVADDRP